MKTKGMLKDQGWSFSFHVTAIKGILTSPRVFFAQLPSRVGYRRPLGFLVVSSIFFAVASLTYVQERRLLMAGIFVVNGLGVAWLSAVVTFLVVMLTIGRGIGFERFFALHAYATGATLLVSWMPLFVWITEPWKWLLIGIGLVNGCHLRKGQAVMVIAISVIILILLFWVTLLFKFWTV